MRRHHWLGVGLAAVVLGVVLALVFWGGGNEENTGRPARSAGETALGLSRDVAVAQLFAVGFSGTGPKAPIVARLRDRDWGAVVLGPSNALAPGQVRGLARAIRRAGTRGGRPAPLVIAAAPGDFPGVRSVSLTEPDDPTDAGDRARQAGRALRAAGVRAVLAPYADLAVVAGPAVGRGFSDDPAEAAGYVKGAVAGWRAAGVAPVVRNFPGEGSASGDPREGAATVGQSLDDLRAGDVKPFAAVAGDAPAMQLSGAIYAAWDGVTPAALLPDAYRLLRRTGFTGAAITSDLGAATAVTGGSVAQAAVDALRAGADLLYIPGDASDQDQAYRAVLAAVRSGKISHDRLADALLHVSAFKRGA